MAATSRAENKSEEAWSKWLASHQPRIEAALEDALPPAKDPPSRLHRAMRYSVFTGGKRVRPALALLGFEVAGGRGRAAYRLGAALELIHTFSLIHDDLPCMDDDDFRRGRLSCHRKYGEAIAVLAGDALQVTAFEVLAGLPTPAELRLQILSEITRAVGTRGVIGGQVGDLEAEGKRVSPDALRRIHLGKTANLLRCSLVTGALLGGAKPPLVRRLAHFGEDFGLLFQVVDDVLNEVGSYRALGRRRGGDRSRGKATYPRILGHARTRRQLDRLFAASRRSIPVEGRKRPIFAGLLLAIAGRLPETWAPQTEGRTE